MQRIFSLLLPITMALTACATAPPPEPEPPPVAQETAPVEVPESLVARVNGVDVHDTEVVEHIEKLKEQAASFGQTINSIKLKELRAEGIRELIEDELLRQAAESQQIEPSEAALEKELESLRQQAPGGPAAFDAFVARTGRTKAELFESVRYRLVLSELCTKVGVKPVSDDDVRAHYETVKDAEFTMPERVKASHILIMTDQHDKEKGLPDAKAKREIKKIYNKASKKKADFAALAKKHSMGPSGPNGGDLGFFRRGMMVKPFEEVAFKMQPGDVSKPVETRFGYHVIKVTEREDAKVLPFEDAQKMIRARLEMVRLSEGREKVVADLWSKATIETVRE